MKLEAKHLSPYLPYDLKLKEGQLSSISKRWGTLKFIDNEGNDYNTSFDKVTPILKPLSLFEYDHILQVKKHLGLGEWCDQYDEYFDVWFGDQANVKKLVLQCPYEIMQFFLECHFDVFGLIDAGVAAAELDLLQKFKKKPIEVVAFQFTKEKHDYLKKNFPKNEEENPVKCTMPEIPDAELGWNWFTQQLYIMTSEGQMDVNVGDWVIRENTKYYPVKNEIFVQTYDAI